MARPTSVASLLAIGACTLALSAAGRAAAAQAAPPPRAPHVGVAINPLAIPFGVFTLDVEGATRTPGLTLGVAGTWVTDGLDQGWADARVMYFPNEVAMRGFAVGLTGGVVAEQGDDGNVRRTVSAPTLGVRMDYDWLVGARKRMLVGIGLGAKRVLRDVSPGSPLQQVYGDGRFVVGLVF